MAEFLEMTDLEFTHGWTKNMLSVMEKAKGESLDAPEIMRRCSSYCYEGKHIRQMVETASTSIEGFMSCLLHDFDWGLEYDRDAGILTCHEGNSVCPCPIVRASGGDISGEICRCTEGMIRRIFEAGLKRRFSTETVRSLVRDGKSCIYRIRLEGLDEHEKDVIAEAAASDKGRRRGVWK